MSRKFNLDYEEIPLSADINRTAPNVDSELINPWGATVIDNTIWIGCNGNGTINNYELGGKKLNNSVIVNLGSNSRGRPTGLVKYDGTGFVISNGLTSAPAKIIIVTEDGSINAYNPTISTTNALEIIDSPGKIFKGAEIVNDNLYITDFKGAVIEKYDSSFNLIAQFTDTDLVRAGYAPFNVYEIDCKLYVTFAKSNIRCPLVGGGGDTDVPGIGNGYIDVFDLHGALLDRFTSRGPLNSPWGMAELRVCKHKHLYRYLLVGNAGDGIINIYNLKTKKYITNLKSNGEGTLVADRLWSIILHFESDLLYTSGAESGSHGIYGVFKNVE